MWECTSAEAGVDTRVGDGGAGVARSTDWLVDIEGGVVPVAVHPALTGRTTIPRHRATSGHRLRSHRITATGIARISERGIPGCDRVITDVDDKAGSLIEQRPPDVSCAGRTTRRRPASIVGYLWIYIPVKICIPSLSVASPTPNLV